MRTRTQNSSSFIDSTIADNRAWWRRVGQTFTSAVDDQAVVTGQVLNSASRLRGLWFCSVRSGGMLRRMYYFSWLLQRMGGTREGGLWGPRVPRSIPFHRIVVVCCAVRSACSGLEKRLSLSPHTELIHRIYATHVLRAISIVPGVNRVRKQ